MISQPMIDRMAAVRTMKRDGRPSGTCSHQWHKISFGVTPPQARHLATGQPQPRQGKAQVIDEAMFDDVYLARAV